MTRPLVITSQPLLIASCHTDVNSVSIKSARSRTEGDIGVQPVVIVTDVAGEELVEFVFEIDAHQVELLILVVIGAAVQLGILELSQQGGEEARVDAVDDGSEHDE